ncbi:MAG: hypothetical protein MOGMAGMI_00979 [Candidatus Omnitrophica bacterium]|nr:hypothetical protein [Candidatus Omnitrophota bacterium]
MRRSVLSLFMVPFLLGNASAALTAGPIDGDQRGGEREEVRFVNYQGAELQVYADGSYWVRFATGDNLYLRNDGTAVAFDVNGLLVSQGSWDPTTLRIASMEGVDPARLAHARNAVQYARDAGSSAHLVPGAPVAEDRSAVPAGSDIEWAGGAE